MENVSTLAMMALLTLGVAVAFAALFRIAVSKTPKVSDLDPAASVDFKEALAGEGWVSRGKFLLLLFVPPLTALALFAIWSGPAIVAGCWSMPLLAMLTVTTMLIVKGSARIRRFGSARPGYSAPEAVVVPDPHIEALLERIARADRGFRDTGRADSLDPLLYQLVDAYDDSDDSTRAAIRGVFRDRFDFSSRLLRVTEQAAGRIDATREPAEVQEHLRRGLLAAAIDFQHGDFRESFMAIDPLRDAAERAGVDIRDTLRALVGPSDPAFGRLALLLSKRYAEKTAD